MNKQVLPWKGGKLFCYSEMWYFFCCNYKYVSIHTNLYFCCFHVYRFIFLEFLVICNHCSSHPRGGYSTLVWVGVCRWDFWNATHPCTHFEGKVTHPCTKIQNFSLKFAPFWRKFRKILKSWPIKVPNWRHFGANFRKFWKIDPSKYHVFEKKGTHWCTWRPDFATHVCGTSL